MDFDCDAAGTVLIRWHAKMNLFVWMQFILLAKEWKEEFVKANTRIIDSFPAVLKYFISFYNSRWIFLLIFNSASITNIYDLKYQLVM